FDFRAGEREYRIAVGGEQPDAIGGTNASDYSWGLGGDDELGGGPEDDILYGDEDRDLLSGNDGQDRLDGGRGGDTLYGGADADNLLGREGDDYLDEGAGHSNVEGGEGNDTLVGGQGPDAFVVSPTSGDDVIRDFTAGPGMFDHIALMDLRWEDLTIEDTSAGVKVSWDGGSVLLEGVDKADLAQDDFMFANSPDLPPGTRAPAGPTEERPTPSVPGPEIVGEAPGGEFGDEVRPQLNSGRLAFDFDKYAVAVGNNGRDALQGSEAWDHLFGRGGKDELRGEGGDDILQGDGGEDLLDGGAGMDRLDGGDDDDRLIGGGQADELMGGDGDDELDEGAGHGMLEGGRGNDLLTGGTGADAFIVAPDSGFDTVTDFEATGLAQGAFDHIAFRDIMPEDVSVTDTGEGALVAWDVDHDGGADGSILLAGVAKADLRQSDFMFVEEPGFVEGINDFGSWYIFPESASPIA
ncbi:MAG: calcium-binding protein, partial [Thermoleophilia bacterium]|nr:calcium-binding protein [Thermoleophilia bacterium]